MLAQQLQTDLKSLQCGTCGVWHAIPQAMFDAALREGGFWHCPNGHSRGYDKGTNEKRIKELEAQVEQERARKAAALARENQANRELTNARTQLKGTKTRLKNVKHRVANGICPCCKRTFLDLQRHMHNKHPDFVKGDDGQKA